MVQEVTKIVCHKGSKRDTSCEGCNKHNLGDKELEFRRKLLEAARRQQSCDGVSSRRQVARTVQGSVRLGIH